MTSATAGLAIAALAIVVLALLVLAGRRKRDANAAAARADALVRELAERDAALRDALEREKASIRLRSEFVFAMSHEIRTAMNGVVGMAELLLRRPLQETERRYAGTIHRSSRALQRVLDDVAEFTTAEAGLLRIEETTFSVQHAIREIEQLFGEPARAKRVQLELSIDPGLPASVRGDPVRLRQILLNLVSNAMQVTEHGRVSVAAVRGERDRIRFEVRDSGPPIPPEQQAALFEAFGPAAANVRDRQGGTRLGLAICRQLVRLMGGELAVVSTPDGHTGFGFEIALPASAPSAPRRADLAAPRRFGPGRVLLVEDDPVSSEVARTMLEHCGLQTVCAQNGREALAAFAKQAFALVLMDCQMPVMDGFEATRRIRDTEAARGIAGTPIVAVTAHANAGNRQKCIDCGMDDYLAKPFDSGALERTLERWLPGRSAAGLVREPAAAAPEDGAQAGDRPLDSAAIETLRSLDPNGEQGLLRRVVDLYLQSAPQHFEKIRSLRQRDPRAAQMAAHTLKSAAARAGAMQVSTLAGEVEAQLQAAEGGPEIGSLLASLEQALDRAAAQLRAISA